MRILPFNHLNSSFMSNANEKVVELLTPQQKRIALVALIVFSYIAVAAYFVWKKYFKGSENTPAVEDVTPKQSLPTTASNDQLESDEKLSAFYEKKNIVTGKEPIQVDVDSLGLDLTEEWQWKNDEEDEGVNKTFTLKKVAEDVVAEINKYLEKSSDQDSIKGKRKIFLNTNRRPIRFYKYLGSDAVFLTDEEKKKFWLCRIFQALIDKGHLFKCTEYNGNYILQA